MSAEPGAELGPSAVQWRSAWNEVASDYLILHCRVSAIWEVAQKGDDYVTLEQVRIMLTNLVRAPFRITGSGMYPEAED